MNNSDAIAPLNLAEVKAFGNVGKLNNMTSLELGMLSHKKDWGQKSLHFVFLSFCLFRGHHIVPRSN